MKNMQPIALPQRTPEDEAGRSNMVELWREQVWALTSSAVWDWFCSYGKGT